MVQAGNNNAQYFPLTTAGTYTVDSGPAAPTYVRSEPGVLYGYYISTYGTTPVLSCYDVYITPTGTTTTLILNGTSTAVNQAFMPMGAGNPIGVRYRGALVVVVTGTANGVNLLWD